MKLADAKTMYIRHKPITAFLGLALSAAGNTHAAPAETIALSQTANNQWQLEARQAELPQLLDAIAGRSGTKLHYISLPAGKVDATCIGDTSALLHCVLGDSVNMALQQGEKGRNAEIWIMGSSLTNSTAGNTTCPALPQSVAVPAIDPVLATENWLKQAHAKDPAQRAQAMAELASGDTAYDLQIRNTLNQALKDSNPQVRVQALEALTNREGETGVGSQLRQALNDNNEDVRIAAVERIENDVGLLELASQDANSTVRDFALLKLQQLENR